MDNDIKKTLGPTGNFPDGQINEEDEGELAFGIAADKKEGIVIINFGKPTAWIGLRPHEVYELAKIMVEKAKEVEGK